ncbi:MAG: hypothetical protein WBB45_02700 [Cyclobacteriaceae bacterium]
MIFTLRTYSLLLTMAAAGLLLTACKTEREILQDKVDLLVRVSEHTEPNMLFLNYMGSPKEDLDAEEGLLVVPMDMVNEDEIKSAAEGTEFVLMVSRLMSDQDEGPVLKLFDPNTGEYSETMYHIIGIKSKESLDDTEE